MREALLHLAARVPEDLQRGLGHLLVVHLQAAEERLERLRRVEGHRVCEGEHLRGRESRRVRSAVIPTESSGHPGAWLHLEQLQSCPDGLVRRDALLLIVSSSIYRFVHLFYQSTGG